MVQFCLFLSIFVFLLYFIFLFSPWLEQDIESFDLEDFKYNSVNITAFRLVDLDSKRVNEIMDQVKKVQKHSGRDLINGSSIMQVINLKEIFYFLFLALQQIYIVICEINDVCIGSN